MPFAVTCPNPNCKTVLKVPDEAEGQRARCSKCGTRMKLDAPTVAIQKVDLSKPQPKPKTASATITPTTQRPAPVPIAQAPAAVATLPENHESLAQSVLRKIIIPAVEPKRDNGLRPCPICGEPIQRQAAKCRHCNEWLDGRQTAQPDQRIASPQIHINNVNHAVATAAAGAATKRWSRLLAMFLSLLLPGLGQLYKGQPINAIVWFVLTAAGYGALIVPGILLHVCCIIGAGMGNPYR